MKNLSPRQAAILDFLARMGAEGRSPTQAEIGRHFGFSQNAARDHLQALAAKGYVELNANSARGVRVLRGRFEHPLPNRLPLIGRVAAGSPLMSEENIEDFLTVDPSLFHPRVHYFRRVQGWSMRRAHIFDGDLVGLHETHEAHNGQIVAVRIQDPLTGDVELTLKRYRHDGQQVLLLSDNDDQQTYAPIRLDPQRDAFQIEGLFCGLIRTSSRLPP